MFCEGKKKLNSRLGTNFESNTRGGRLGVIDRLSTGLYIRANTVVVAGGEGIQVAKAVKGDSIFRGVVANGSRVTGDLALSDVVRSLGTNEESITTENSVGGERRTL